MKCRYFEDVIKYQDYRLSVEKSQEIEQHLESCEDCRKLMSLLSFSKNFISKEPEVAVDFYSMVSSRIDGKRYKGKNAPYKLSNIIKRIKPALKPLAALASALILIVLLINHGIPFIENLSENSMNADLPVSGLHNRINAWDIVNKMGKGINLGNTLESPYEGEWGLTAKEYFFDDFKEAGFSNVRIPVRWDKHMGTKYPYTIDSSWLDRVEQVLDWSLSRGFVTILDSHHDDWIKENYSENIERFESLWEQLAARFSDKPENLVFEICNEPFGNITDNEINEMNKRILAKIRTKSPTRSVVIGGGNWYSYESLLKNVEVPSDPYIIATFHYYEPFNFTNQGQGTWGSENDKTTVREAFEKIRGWSLKKNIPVLLGELGVTGVADRKSRIKYYDYITDEALKNGFAFSVWDNGLFGTTPDDNAFYNRSAREFDQPILEAVINTPILPSALNGQFLPKGNNGLTSGK